MPGHVVVLGPHQGCTHPEAAAPNLELAPANASRRPLYQGCAACWVVQSLFLLPLVYYTNALE
jgi:hypothetical protein